MKKRISLLAVASMLGAILAAQPSLSYETHRLKTGIDNSMSYCKYMDPGIAGEGVVWDFSQLQFERTFTGFIKASTDSEIGKSYTGSNTELVEFNAQFYFRIEDNKIEQYGYSSSSGSVQTRYDVPFVKMKYPFSYGESYSGSFSGKSYYSGVEKGDILGSYTIEADAWGMLILPGDVKYENTLRVKTEKSYNNELAGSDQDVYITTYRWYNSLHRYPLLVLTEYTVSSGDNSTVNYQAAYNNNAVDGISPISSENIILYPNPTTENLMLEYDAVAAGILSFSIIDNSGKVLREFDHEITQGGTQKFNLSQEIDGLIPANYLLIIKSGDKSFKHSFSLVE